MLSVVILNVVGLNVMAPTKGLGLIILMHSVNIAVQILDLRLDLPLIALSTAPRH